ncbi:MAG: hypothetical protein RJA02_1098, partial [Armatimonadota bacterium]
MSDQRRQFRLPPSEDVPGDINGKRIAIANLAGLITGILSMGVGKAITNGSGVESVSYGWSVFLTVPL